MRTWLSWPEARDLLVIDDRLLFEFFAEDLLHPAHEFLRPFNAEEVHDLAGVLEGLQRRDRPGDS